MVKYILTNKAVADLTSIWNYTIKEWSEYQAEKYYESLIDTFKKITKNPDIGRKYDNILSGLYGIISNKHIVFYRIIEKDKIEITRVLHQSMDTKRIMLA